MKLVHPTLGSGIVCVALFLSGAVVEHMSGCKERDEIQARTLVALRLARIAGYEERRREEQPLIAFCHRHNEDAHRWWEAERWREGAAHGGH